MSRTETGSLVYLLLIMTKTAQTFAHPTGKLSGLLIWTGRLLNKTLYMQQEVRTGGELFSEETFKKANKHFRVIIMATLRC